VTLTDGTPAVFQPGHHPTTRQSAADAPERPHVADERELPARISLRFKACPTHACSPPGEACDPRAVVARSESLRPIAARGRARPVRGLEHFLEDAFLRLGERYSFTRAWRA
jgi:hypothetical protein